MTPKQSELYSLENTHHGGLIDHALQCLQVQKLDTPTRRTLGIVAKRYLVDHYMTDGTLTEQSSHTANLIKVTLAGLARAEDAIAILVGYAEIVDADNLKNACKNAGPVYLYLFALADSWWGMTSHPTGWRCTGQEQQKVYRPQAIKAYKQNSCLETAQAVVRSYLPLAEYIHLTRLSISPGLDQAYEAYSKARGYGIKACTDYIQHLTIGGVW